MSGLLNVTSSVGPATAGGHAGSFSVTLYVMTLKNNNQHWLWSDHTGFAGGKAEGDIREGTMQEGQYGVLRCRYLGALRWNIIPLMERDQIWNILDDGGRKGNNGNDDLLWEVEFFHTFTG